MQELSNKEEKNIKENQQNEVHGCCEHGADTQVLTDKPNIDPVCGMKTASDINKSLSHAGSQYYFCSQKCLEKFRKHPMQYLQPEGGGITRNANRYNKISVKK